MAESSSSSKFPREEPGTRNAFQKVMRKKVKSRQTTLDLKPTQFSVGMLEIEHKVLRLREMSKRKLAKYLRKRKIPIVVSPWNELCVIDHHHLLFACWHAGIRKVRIEVTEDYRGRKISYLNFWKKMKNENHCYPYDQFGEGPRSPLYLPIDVRGMADDPYRSLAWMVRKEGGYENSNETFAEFQWADLFRKYKLLEKTGRSGYQRALQRAVRLAQSQSAKDLPGYINRKQTRKEMNKLAAEQAKSVVEKKHKANLALIPHALR